jgi:hypothetical protein
LEAAEQGKWSKSAIFAEIRYILVYRGNNAMENQEAAVAAIRTCKTRKDLDDMLERFEIKDTVKAIACLNTCMYTPLTFASPKPIPPEDDLEFAKQIFLTGTWRLNEYYDRMGIGMAVAGV